MPHIRNIARPTSVLITILVVFGCSPGQTVSSTTEPLVTSTTEQAASTTSSSMPTTTVSSLAPTTQPQGDTVTVLLYPFSEMGPEWGEQVFPYGESEDTLGASPGGEGLMLGPEYGAQAPDGTWWFLDAANLRLAHFSEDGVYLDQVEVPTDMLVDGQYFQWQMPQAMDDGSIVASGLRGEANSSLLRLVDDSLTESTVEASVPWVNTDGSLLYGYSLADESPWSLDPSTQTLGEPDWFRSRAGSRYLVWVQQDEVIVELPDVGATKTLQMRFSDDPSVEAQAGIEVETGTNGALYILFYGIPASDETLDIGGIVTIDPEGTVGQVEPAVSPFTPSDPGSPSRLGVRPGTSTMWMMVVGEDGVHVYTKQG